mmetsp:Transcript_26523/g.87944  ORF Transcript_26523/g.87944 Transcript_26523/m.87944 type:complete len:316 (+) Transcript_26523:90-1037(+)
MAVKAFETQVTCLALSHWTSDGLSDCSTLSTVPQRQRSSVSSADGSYVAPQSPQPDEPLQRAKPRGGRAMEGPAPWRLVLCNEKCHKPEQSELREALARIARVAGGRLLCLKKASKYADWLTSERDQLCNGQHLLLSDWREAKPCAKALEAVSFRPTVFMIMTGGQQLLTSRVEQWVAREAAACGICEPIEIIEDVASIPALLAHYAPGRGGALCGGSDGTMPAPMLLSSILAEHSECVHEQDFDLAPTSSSWAPSTWSPPPPPSWFPNAQGPWPVQQMVWSTLRASLGGQEAGGMTSHDVEAVLAAALPDVYED